MGYMELKVGITGQSGFMGSHLYNFLGTKKDQIKRVHFNRHFFDDISKLDDFVSECDVIVHIAAMNRHEDQQVIYDTNVGLVKNLIGACKRTQATPRILFASSTQEERDNLYGKSKRDGRALLENWAENAKAGVTSLIIPNVFGPFGKPNYNSFIATFCHKIINNEEHLSDSTNLWKGEEFLIGNFNPLMMTNIGNIFVEQESSSCLQNFTFQF